MKTINNITIIGGGGNFGKFMKHELEKVGFQVFTILEQTSNEEKQEILNKSDVVIFSVSIRNTIEAIRDLVKFRLNPDTLVMDVTGLKTGINAELENLGTYEFVSIHPMFGPSTKSLEGKNLVQTTIEINGGKKWKILRRFAKKLGGNIRNLNETKHDFNMALVQATSHFLNLVFGNVLKNLGIDLENLDNLATPNFKGQEEIFLRILRGQSGSTFADMQIQNTEFKNNVLNEILGIVEGLGNIVQSGDSKGFEEMFSELQEKFL